MIVLRASLLRSRTLLVAIALLVTFVSAHAQSSTPGTIEGRVLNARSGEYVAGARISVQGSALETFTDSDGKYRLSNVPTGSARVTTFYTGLPTLTTLALVTAGQTSQHDITMSTAGAKTDGTVVKLDAFRVETSREMDAAALAINEQRFASNIKNVVSTDEFGSVAEGNVAEFLKFMPGITIDYTGGNARDVSINGVPSAYVPITVDGFNVASAAGRATARNVQADMVSINNLSRIEVSYSPTPESQGSALAGSVNMVPRSSFERARPMLNYSVYVLMRDNARDFHPEPGPKPSPTRNIHPGFDFSYVAPVNNRFGYTVSAGVSSNYSPQERAMTTWLGVVAPTNGVAFPHTTPDKPYLSSYNFQDEPKVTMRRSFGATVDYKLTAHDRFSLGFQYTSFDGRFTLHNQTFNPLRVLPGAFTTTSTQGAPGAGDVTMGQNEKNRFNRTYMPTLTWRHDGPEWQADAGAGFSQQSDYNRDTEQGYFRTVSVRRTNVTVAFNDIFYLRPRVITVQDGTTGAPVDPYLLSNYALTGATSQRDFTHDLQSTAYGNLKRDFYTRVPFTLKTGFYLRQAQRDIRGGVLTYNYVGPDGRASTTPIGGDDNAAPFLDASYSRRMSPYGFPQSEVPSTRKIAHPNYFTTNANTDYRGLVTNSKFAEEIVSALYLRGDVSSPDRRLKLVGGVRAEQTNVDASGFLTDLSRNVQRSAQGQAIIGANGRPLAITSDPLEISKLTYLDRGARAQKEYLRFFPSLNATYNVRENLIARAAYYESVGRPNFNQYAGGVTLPDPESPPSNANRSVVNNAAIKAWSARTVSVRLEHYFEGVGQFSVGAFRRQFENFFGATTFNATPEFLALYSIDQATYEAYDVATQHNITSTVRMDGFDFNYKQTLAFLPHWARGVQVFANGSSQRAIGDASSNFAGFIPLAGSWGVSLTRKKFNTRVNWNYRGRQRQAAVAPGASIEPGTFTWGSKRLYVDVLGEYYLKRQVALFFNLRNVGDATEDTEVSGPSTPAHAQFRTRLDYASLWTFGIKGTF